MFLSEYFLATGVLYQKGKNTDKTDAQYIFLTQI